MVWNKEMSQIVYINPNNVYISKMPHGRDVKSQMALLEKQGQVVPLVAKLHEAGIWIVDNSDYPWAVAQIMAARELGWSSVILTDDAGENN
jgi:hypothetical protein